MLLDINDLWNSRDEREWLIALDRSWLTLADRRDHELVQFIHSVDLEYVRGLGVQEWYDFLIKYFHWQFAGNRLQQKLRDLDKNSFEQLFSVKCSLVEIDQPELADARKCLSLVRSARIRGLDYPGTSGLLSLLFKEWFGTADICILESLRKIQSLPEKRKVREIRAWVKTKNDWRDTDAVLVINIMRRKAAQLNTAFSTNKWTPSSISIILSTSNRPTRNAEESARATQVHRL
ncbi:MAG TPA: hypothetical protein VMU05_21260 [Dongiaceae bacterium]|nr:hypothetical protein [Dongiaceae bacterium]